MWISPRFITKIRQITQNGPGKRSNQGNRNKSKRIYEFVLPPVDMHMDDNSLKVIIDIPGFDKKDIELTLCGDILSIRAHKVTDEKESETLILNQRPNIIDKKLDFQLTSSKVKKK